MNTRRKTGVDWRSLSGTGIGGEENCWLRSISIKTLILSSQWAWCSFWVDLRLFRFSAKVQKLQCLLSYYYQFSFWSLTLPALSQEELDVRISILSIEYGVPLRTFVLLQHPLLQKGSGKWFQTISTPSTTIIFMVVDFWDRTGCVTDHLFLNEEQQNILKKKSATELLLYYLTRHCVTLK